MTRSIHTTDILELKEIKVTCNACGASFTVPVARGRSPKKCHNCAAELPADGIDELADAIHRVAEGVGRKSISISFETEEK